MDIAIVVSEEVLWAKSIMKFPMSTIDDITSVTGGIWNYIEEGEVFFKAGFLCGNSCNL